MPVRSEVQQLVDLGRFPPSGGDVDPDDIDHRAALIRSIKPPLTQEEAAALMTCFGPDEAFGLAWSLVHLIEKTDGGVFIENRPPPSENEWMRLLWERAQRGRRFEG